MGGFYCLHQSFNNDVDNDDSNGIIPSINLQKQKMSNHWYHHFKENSISDNSIEQFRADLNAFQHHSPFMAQQQQQQSNNYSCVKHALNSISSNANCNKSRALRK